jgi:hypothetical protein
MRGISGLSEDLSASQEGLLHGVISNKHEIRVHTFITSHDTNLIYEAPYYASTINHKAINIKYYYCARIYAPINRHAN